MERIEIARVFYTQRIKSKLFQTSNNTLFVTENDAVNYAKDEKLEDNSITELNKADYLEEIEEVKLEIELAKEPVAPEPVTEPENPPV